MATGGTRYTPTDPTETEQAESLPGLDGGVFYAKGSEHNKASKLHGPVQTSYRAELRAVLHVVKTASCRILVMCDCKSVVNTFQDFQMHGRRKCGALQEEDLWTQIFDIMEGRDEIVKVKWMPSHLDDPKNRDKKEKALGNKIICEDDILGNVEADKLADKGVIQHTCNNHHAAFAAAPLPLLWYIIQTYYWTNVLLTKVLFRQKYY